VVVSFPELKAGLTRSLTRAHISKREEKVPESRVAGKLRNELAGFDA
jgi:hypothetical protein